LWIYQIATSLLFALGLSISANPEQLPIKSYTTGDGLPVDYVKRIMRDSHGFLWFCTRDGLSKFDGYQFTNYGKEQGLPYPNVNDLIESGGSYWVATNGAGVSSFNPSERVPFNTLRASRFIRLIPIRHQTASTVCARTGRVASGRERIPDYSTLTKRKTDLFAPSATTAAIYSLLVDRQGVLWMGVGNHLWRRNPDGPVVRYSFETANDLGRIFSLVEDNEGKLWVGSWYAGLFRLDVPLLPNKDSTLQVDKTKGSLDQYKTVQGAVIGAVEDLRQSPDGHLWIAASPDFTTGLGGGLFEFHGDKFRRYGTAAGVKEQSY
jgi:ligand-binding sensor domain-containing protein